MGEEPEFGPGGYLPQRAAQRARKIVLREQLGVGWIVGSVVAGAVLLAVGIAFLVARTGPPGPPFVAAAPVDEVPPGTAVRTDAGEAAVLLVRAGGRLRAFAAPDEGVRWCADAGRLEGSSGTVWEPDGTRVGGPGASLAPHPAEVHRGTIYVDVSRALAPQPARADGDAAPVCAPAETTVGVGVRSTAR